MNILVDGRPLQDRRSGGVRRLAEGLLPALKQASPDLNWIVGTTGTHRYSGSDIHVPMPNKILSALFALRLSSLDMHFDQAKADAMLFFNLGFSGPISIPYALIVHDLSFLIEPKWFRPRARIWHKLVSPKRMIKHARRIFAVSDNTKQDLIRLLQVDEQSIDTIPLGIDTLPPANPPANPPQGKFIIVIGDGDPRKNTSVALEAARQNGIQAILTGKSGKNVTADAELAWLYEHASAFLYPSWYEGFGIPLHEAAHYGTPIIASTAAPLPITAPTGTIFAAPEKPHHWVKALKDILEKPDAYRTSTQRQDWSAAAKIISDRMRHL
ncbi:glycosyltransferase family 4 protein [Candidatus Uhrbacteria bacterium]|nr:glycosyltransferase family 4 protein [Candidatus Uhrbacteria bacterium]